MTLVEFIIENAKNYPDRKMFYHDACYKFNVSEKTVRNRIGELGIKFKSDNQKKNKKESCLITGKKYILDLLNKEGWVTEKYLKRILPRDLNNNWVIYSKEIEKYKIQLNEKISIYAHPSIQKDILNFINNKGK